MFIKPDSDVKEANSSNLEFDFKYLESLTPFIAIEPNYTTYTNMFASDKKQNSRAVFVFSVSYTRTLSLSLTHTHTHVRARN